MNSRQIRIAKLIEAGKRERREEYAGKLKKYFDSEELENILDEVMLLVPPKKERAAVHWILNGNLELPEDMELLDRAFEILDRKKDSFEDYNSPEEVMESNFKVSRRLNFDPDNEPAFTRKKKLGNGIVVYRVEDSPDGMLAVREAMDVCWGERANPWCLVSRNEKLDDEEMEFAVDYEEDEDLIIKSLDGAWMRWKTYSSYPKRIAFKNGKLFAFCASPHRGELKWWDRYNNEMHYLGGVFDSEGYELADDYVGMMKDPLVPAEILADFYDADEEDVRLAVAENERTPDYTLEILAYDDSVKVANAARKALRAR